MKISSIQNNYSQVSKNNNPTFEGTWRKKTVYGPSGNALYTQKIYTPDKGESLHKTAKAWKEETGLYPFDWAKTKSPYKQINDYKMNNDHRDIEYRLSYSPYLPISLLKASIHQKISDNKRFDIERVNGYIELAGLSSQENDPLAVKEYEDNVVYEYLNAPTLPIKRSFVAAMNEYKDHWGSAIWALDIKKAAEKHFYRKSDELAEEYKQALASIDK